MTVTVLISFWELEEIFCSFSLPLSQKKRHNGHMKTVSNFLLLISSFTELRDNL